MISVHKCECVLEGGRLDTVLARKYDIGWSLLSPISSWYEGPSVVAKRDRTVHF